MTRKTARQQEMLGRHCADSERAREYFDYVLRPARGPTDGEVIVLTTAFATVRAEGEAEGLRRAAALKSAVCEAVPILRALMSKPEGVLVGMVRELTEGLERLAKGE